MTQKEIELKILEFFEENFSEDGFKLVKSRKSAIRNNDLGSQIISYGLTNYNPHFSIAFAVGMKCAFVEEYALPFLFASEKHMKDARHSITTLIHMLPGLDLVRGVPIYEIRGEEDMDRIFAHAPSVIKAEGYDYFQKYSSLDDIEKGLNNDFRKNTGIFPGPITMFLGIIAAKKLNREYYQELVNSYRNFSHLAPFYFPKRFNDLLDSLERENW